MSRGAVTGVAYSDGTNLRPGFLCRPLKAAPAPRPELGSGGGVFKLGAAQRGLGSEDPSAEPMACTVHRQSP